MHLARLAAVGVAAEVVGLEDLADLDLRLAVHRVRAASTHSMASSIDLTWMSQKPAISSLVSAKGPSMTVRSFPENRTRAPFELGWSPSS